MSEIEEKAINKLKYIIGMYSYNNYYSTDDLNSIEIILNLVEKQQKEIEDSNEIFSALKEYYSITVDDIKECIKKDM